MSRVFTLFMDSNTFLDIYIIDICIKVTEKALKEKDKKQANANKKPQEVIHSVLCTCRFHIRRFSQSQTENSEKKCHIAAE